MTLKCKYCGHDTELSEHETAQIRADLDRRYTRDEQNRMPLSVICARCIPAHTSRIVQAAAEGSLRLKRIRAEHPDITEEALASNPLRHVLTNVIGAKPDTEVRVEERTLVDGEVLLMCSDGLYGPLDTAALTALMNKTSPLETKAQEMLLAALDGGSRDNATVLLVEYHA